MIIELNTKYFFNSENIIIIDKFHLFHKNNLNSNLYSQCKIIKIIINCYNK